MRLRLSPWAMADIFSLPLVTVGTFLLYSGWPIVLPLPQDALTALTGGGLAFLYYTLYWYWRRRRTLPCYLDLVQLLPRLGIFFGLVALSMMLSGLAWSRPAFLLYFGLSLLWSAVRIMLEIHCARPRIALAPGGRWQLLAADPGRARIQVLEQPEPVSGGSIVADWDALPAHWKRPLSMPGRQQVPIYDVASAYEMLNGRICLEQPSHIPATIFCPPLLYRWCKNLFDFLFSLILLLTILPLMIVLGIAIRLDSPGPILFAQKRVGRMGRKFNMLKFRTMDAATSRGDFQHSTGSKDQRITRSGRLLRKFRLDELPQLFNVIRGEMSLIGPRPAVREVHDRHSRLIPLYSYRRIVRPGITGWAQVRQGYVSDESLADSRKKVEYDLYYIKHCSLQLDIVIFLMTLTVILGGRGAR